MARKRTGERTTLPVNAVAFTVMWIGGLVVLPTLGNVQLSDFTQNWQLYLLAALSFVAALALLYRASSHLESATVSVLGTSNAIFTLILAGIIYGERLTTGQIIGSSLLLPCIWYMALLARSHHRMLKVKDLKSVSWLKGVGLVLLSSLAMSIGHILEKKIFENSSVGSYVAFGWMLEVMMAWILVFMFSYKSINVLRQKSLVLGAAKLGILRIGAGLCFFYAIKAQQNISLLTIIINFRIIIVAVLAGWLLNERRFYYRKLIAAVLSVVALSIVFWS
ncbi:MAG: DMT family transporter [bacterium]|nr:DMT family transporter [bacterium]